MDGLALAARFSIATNRLQYCGPADAAPRLYAAIVAGHGTPETRRALWGFEALRPYLSAIGTKHGLDPLDARVVEAYWIGNELLDDFSRPEFAALLEALRRSGLPRSIATTLKERLPEHAIPHHVFHVAYVGVGAVTGHVPTTLANLEACRPAAAVVTGISEGHLTLRRSTVRVGASGLTFGPDRVERVPYDAAVLPGLRVGATIALHWGWPALELDAARAAALDRYSRASMAAANAVPSLYDLAGGGPST